MPLLERWGWECWRLKGQSYLLELAQALSNSDRVYRAEDGIAFIDTAIYDFIQQIPKKIYVSATLSNIEEILGEGKKVSINLKTKVNYIMYTAIRVPERRREAELPKVVALLKELSAHRPAVFLPCHRYLQRVREELEKLGITVSTDPRKTRTGVLLTLVAGGRWAEAVDISDRQVAVIISVPFALPDEYLYHVFEWGRGQGVENVRSTFYTLPAVTRAVQAAGRVTRNPATRRVVIFADARYRELFKLFPEWLKAQRWYITSDLAELTSLVASFAPEAAARA